jgi:beta-mannosidase
MRFLIKLYQLKLTIVVLTLFSAYSLGQEITVLDSDYCDWYFSIGKSKKQYMAIVPGSNINDLVCNQLIPQPYIDNHLQDLKWIEDSTYTYITHFDLQVDAGHKYEILCEGLDTYAEVFLNNQIIIKGSNMFLAYRENITPLLRNGTNMLKIVFKSTVHMGMQKAIRSAIRYPADNEEGEIKVSPFIRKAAFQFGWDINPRAVSCGIWQPIKIISTSNKSNTESTKNVSSNVTPPFYQLKQDKDASGESFAFFDLKNKPQQHFMYGANYVPYNMYPLPLKNYKRVAHIQQHQGLPNRYDYYRNLFQQLKSYGCNMLRVWGGGWYEDDYFYSLADSMHIAVWQDFMFANTMYPGDEEWVINTKKEIQYQINRLKKHPCIVVWSGNNEIEVAWKNWGWQNKYHYSKDDSLKLIKDYQLLFEKIIPDELKNQHVERSYISSSPISNWGRSEDFKKGDNHYWGVWHGEAPLEEFNTHIPRFASEYGMPSAATETCIKKYCTLNRVDSFTQSRLKSYKGVHLLKRYISDYLPIPFHDTMISFASRYIQLKALKTAYNAHLFHSPICGGSLFWQFNESWPGVTWAAIDFSGNRKIPPYANPVACMLDPNDVIKIKATRSIKYLSQKVNLHIDLKDIDGKILKQQITSYDLKDLLNGIQINLHAYFDSTQLKAGYVKLDIHGSNLQEPILDTIIFITKEKDLAIKKPLIRFVKLDQTHLKISSDVLVSGLFLSYMDDDETEFNQNFLTIEPGIDKIITLKTNNHLWQAEKIKYLSVYDLKL